MHNKAIRPTEAEFLKMVEPQVIDGTHVEGHEMTVFRDRELWRHVRFRNPKSLNQYFDLVTWPGSLCFTGDMGTFVFSRVPDMFDFFRDYPADGPAEGPLSINPDYWSEKIDAQDRRSGYEQYSPDKFRWRVMEYLNDVLEDESGIRGTDLREAVQRQVLSAADDGEWAAFSAAINFKFEDFRFVDFGHVDCREYTYYYIWCCYAIVWGIRQYDKKKVTITIHETKEQR